jgi:CO/xanthine dehydrogenase FAD-binding subunit
VRNAMVISAAGTCLAVDVPSRSVRIALGAVGPTIIRCPDAERYLAERVDWEAGAVTDAVAAEFASRVAAAARPIDDHRSSAEYRRHAIGVLAGRLLRRAFPDG